MKNNIAAIVLTKNEEKNIVDCLETLSWCDEVIVVDDNSSDRTLDLAKKFGARVYNRTLGADFSAQRNFGLGHAAGEWVIFVDADERISESLREEIIAMTKIAKYDGFKIPRVDYLWGSKLEHGETGNIQLLRLGMKGKGKWVGKVHEVWEVNGQVGTLTNEINHYPHQTIKEFLEELNTYSDLRAQELFDKGEKTNIFLIVLYTKGKFFMNYFIKRGFLDGVPGLIHAMLMSFHSFLVRSKLWFLYEKEYKKE